MKLLLITLIPLIILVIILVIEVGIAFLLPKGAIFTNPERTSRSFGEGGDPLRYLVMGDSTGAGQGAVVDEGIAVLSAKYLAQKNKVEFMNVSISGATVADVISDQLKFVDSFKPDIILISAGANNVTHLTRLGELEQQIDQLISEIVEKNCKAKIIVTATPDMGTVPRFLFPLNFLATFQTNRQNEVFDRIITKYDLTLAPIALETGPIFRKDKSLFAEDKFHPNERGYLVWADVIHPALDKAIASQPSHCK